MALIEPPRPFDLNDPNTNRPHGRNSRRETQCQKGFHQPCQAIQGQKDQTLDESHHQNLRPGHTCVLLFDHSALTNFEDNKVAIPITVLEELDRFKVGNETKHFEARECIRILDRLSQEHSLQQWIPVDNGLGGDCLLYTSPSPRDGLLSRMPSSA